MTRLAFPALMLAALAACAGSPARPGDRPAANPSALVAAELAFSRAASVDGQWTAFRDYAADDAVMFVPEPVVARDWLKGRADPPAAVTWQPHRVWTSCDGTMGGTLGAWQRPDGSRGYFTTVWERQRNGEYKWVMDQGDALTEPMAEPEMIDAEVASCDPLAPATQTIEPTPGVVRAGASKDGSFRWSVRVDPWCGRIVTYAINRGAGRSDDPANAVRGFETVVTRTIAPPPAANGQPARACEA